MFELFGCRPFHLKAVTSSASGKYPFRQVVLSDTGGEAWPAGQGLGRGQVGWPGHPGSGSLTGPR